MGSPCHTISLLSQGRRHSRGRCKAGFALVEISRKQACMCQQWGQKFLEQCPGRRNSRSGLLTWLINTRAAIKTKYCESDTCWQLQEDPETFIMNYICRQPCYGELVLGPRNLKELNRPAARGQGLPSKEEWGKVWSSLFMTLWRTIVSQSLIEAITEKGSELICPMLPRPSGEVSGPRLQVSDHTRAGDQDSLSHTGWRAFNSRLAFDLRKFNC